MQQVLDTALAWAVIKHHFEIADFLLGHGADINTNWCSHEPANILHELVWHNNYEAMHFLIARETRSTVVKRASTGLALLRRVNSEDNPSSEIRHGP